MNIHLFKYSASLFPQVTPTSDKNVLLSLFICFFSGPYRFRVLGTTGAPGCRKPPGARRCACSPFPRAACSQITLSHICFCAVSLSRFSAVVGSSRHNRNQNDGWAAFRGDVWKESGIWFISSDRNQSILERVRRAKNLRVTASDHNRANFSFLTESPAAFNLHWNCHKTKKMLTCNSGVNFPHLTQTQLGVSWQKVLLSEISFWTQLPC